MLTPAFLQGIGRSFSVGGDLKLFYKERIGVHFMHPNYLILGVSLMKSVIKSPHSNFTFF